MLSSSHWHLWSWSQMMAIVRCFFSCFKTFARNSHRYGKVALPQCKSLPDKEYWQNNAHTMYSCNNESRNSREKRDCWLGINRRSSNTVLIPPLSNLAMLPHRTHSNRSMLIYCVIGKTITTAALHWGSAASVSIYTISWGLKEKSMTFKYSTSVFNKSLLS